MRPSTIFRLAGAWCCRSLPARFVFGASVEDSDTGYALTADEVRGHVGDVTQLVDATPTGSCVG